MLNIFGSKKVAKFSGWMLLAASISLLTACGGGGGPKAGAAAASAVVPPVASGVPAVVTAATIQLSGAPATVKSDGSTSSTITVTAVSLTNAVVPGATITLSVDSGLLSTNTLVTGANGQATATYSSGAANKANRTATITAKSGAATALLPIQIVGSTVAVTATATSLPANGTAPVTMTIAAKDAGGATISGVPVTMTQVGSGTVTLTPATGMTDANGNLIVSVAGATAGLVTITANAAGATAPIGFTVAPVGSTFGISQLTLNATAPVVPVNPKTSAMKIGDTLLVKVNAPLPTTQVSFATTIGTWNGVVNSVITVPVTAGIASATLTTAVAGVANIQVFDPLSAALSDNMTVGMTALTPHHISLQASRSVVSKSVGTSVGFSNLTAMVYDVTGAPVGGAPVAFSIVGGSTNSGETVSPVVVFSAATTTTGLALGAAPTVFSSGSLASGATGVQIRASVVGTTISTQPIGIVNPTTSSLDTAIVVGGTAGSVAFGQAAQIIDAGGTSTVYSMPMSVLVADSNGNPAPLGTVVSISTTPIAWTTGAFGCSPDQDNQVYGIVTPAVGLVPPVYGYLPGNGGTFFNEDANQNLVLDAGEDGMRKFFASGALSAGVGTKDNQITALNSYGGTVVSTNPLDAPGTTTTDATGLASFNLTYTKSSAFWIISRIHASAMVQGSPAVGQLDFRLLASKADVTPICYLPKSPFTY